MWAQWPLDQHHDHHQIEFKLVTLHSDLCLVQIVKPFGKIKWLLSVQIKASRNQQLNDEEDHHLHGARLRLHPEAHRHLWLGKKFAS